MSDISLNPRLTQINQNNPNNRQIKLNSVSENNQILQSLLINDQQQTVNLNQGNAAVLQSLFGGIANNTFKISPLNNELIKSLQKSGFQGDVLIDNYKGNSNREAAIITSPNFDPQKPAEVLYFLHGMLRDGSIKGALFHAEGGVMNELKNTKRNLILVIPQGPHTTNGKDSGGVTNDPDYALSTQSWFGSADKNADFSDFKAAVEQKIRSNFGPVKISSNTIAGHSAGGRVLANIAQRDSQAMSTFSKVINMDGVYASSWLKDLVSNYSGKIEYYNATNNSSYSSAYPGITRKISGTHYSAIKTALKNEF